MARAFNGTSQSLQSASALAGLAGKSRLAISFWINTTFAADDDILLETSTNSNSTSGTLKVIANESGTNAFWVDTLGNAGKAARTCTAPSNSVWHQIVINLDYAGSGGAEIESIYVDGTSQTLTNQATFDNTGTFSSQVLYVMSRANSTLFADGSMADLCIWAPSTAISGTDITNLAAGRRASTVRNSEILYYWPLAGSASPEPAAVGSIALTVNGATSATDPAALDALGGGPLAITAGTTAAVTTYSAAPVSTQGITASATPVVTAASAAPKFLGPVTATATPAVTAYSGTAGLLSPVSAGVAVAVTTYASVPALLTPVSAGATPAVSVYTSAPRLLAPVAVTVPVVSTYTSVPLALLPVSSATAVVSTTASTIGLISGALSIATTYPVASTYSAAPVSTQGVTASATPVVSTATSTVASRLAVAVTVPVLVVTTAAPKSRQGVVSAVPVLSVYVSAPGAVVPIQAQPTPVVAVLVPMALGTPVAPKPDPEITWLTDSPFTGGITSPYISGHEIWGGTWSTQITGGGYSDQIT